MQTLEYVLILMFFFQMRCSGSFGEPVQLEIFRVPPLQYKKIRQAAASNDDGFLVGSNGNGKTKISLKKLLSLSVNPVNALVEETLEKIHLK